jgi:hypothetical protein
MEVRITKCYLVQVLDEEGNELECEYVFGNKEDAIKHSKEMKSSIKYNGGMNDEYDN